MPSSPRPASNVSELLARASRARNRSARQRSWSVRAPWTRRRLSDRAGEAASAPAGGEGRALVDAGWATRSPKHRRRRRAIPQSAFLVLLGYGRSGPPGLDWCRRFLQRDRRPQAHLPPPIPQGIRTLPWRPHSSRLRTERKAAANPSASRASTTSSSSSMTPTSGGTFVGKYGMTNRFYADNASGAGQAAHVVGQGRINFLFAEPQGSGPQADAMRWHPDKHGNGVRDVAFRVKDARRPRAGRRARGQGGARSTSTMFSSARRLPPMAIPPTRSFSASRTPISRRDM